MTKRKIQYWVIPPEADAEFIAAMEDILDTYETPYAPARPVLCMDEQPVQLHKETRKSIPATKRHRRRVDYEYERCGTACVFMFTEPLSGWREATVRPQRTKIDWALEMARLLDTRYKKAQKTVLVNDNLNTTPKEHSMRPLPQRRLGFMSNGSTFATRPATEATTATRPPAWEREHLLSNLLPPS